MNSQAQRSPMGRERTTSQPIDDVIQDIVETFSGTLRFYAHDLETGRVISRDAEVVSPTASCIKTFMLLVLMRDVDRGLWNLDETFLQTPEVLVGGSGTLKHLKGQTSLSLRNVAQLMIGLSDNVATNMIVDLLGKAHINREIQALGFLNTEVRNRIDFDAVGDDLTRLAVSTVKDCATLMQGLYQGTLLSAASSEVMLDIMGRQHYLDLLPRFLPINPYAEDLGEPSPIKVANKTGFYPGFRGDMAVISTAQKAIVICAFAIGSQDVSFNPESEPARTLGFLGQAIYDEMFQP